MAQRTCGSLFIVLSALNDDLGDFDSERGRVEPGPIRGELASRQTHAVRGSAAAVPSVRTGQRVNHVSGIQRFDSGARRTGCTSAAAAMDGRELPRKNRLGPCVALALRASATPPSKTAVVPFCRTWRFSSEPPTPRFVASRHQRLTHRFFRPFLWAHWVIYSAIWCAKRLISDSHIANYYPVSELIYVRQCRTLPVYKPSLKRLSTLTRQAGF